METNTTTTKATTCNLNFHAKREAKSRVAAKKRCYKPSAKDLLLEQEVEARSSSISEGSLSADLVGGWERKSQPYTEEVQEDETDVHKPIRPLKPQSNAAMGKGARHRAGRDIFPPADRADYVTATGVRAQLAVNPTPERKDLSKVLLKERVKFRISLIIKFCRGEGILLSQTSTAKKGILKSVVTGLESGLSVEELRNSCPYTQENYVKFYYKCISIVVGYYTTKNITPALSNNLDK